MAGLWDQATNFVSGLATGGTPAAPTAPTPVAGASGPVLLVSGPVAPPAAAPAEPQLSFIEDLLINGFQIGTFGLLILCGIIAVAPFSFFGYLGLNLLATGAVGMAALKAASQGFTVITAKYLKIILPRWKILHWVLQYSPWYIYDLLQTISPNFENEGYKIPFLGKPIDGTKGGKGRVNGLVIGGAMAAIGLGGFAFLDLIPQDLITTIKPKLETGLTVLNALTAIGGAGIGTWVLMPKIRSTMETVVNYKGKAAAPTASGPTQKGGQRGGATGNPGGSIPNLRDIANGMLGPDVRGDPAPYTSSIQSGGRSRAAPPMDASILVWGVLGMIATGGIATALLRQRLDSFRPVE
jgi:hypothetical protein